MPRNRIASRLVNTLERWKYRAIVSVKLLDPARRLIRDIHVVRRGGVGDVLMTTPALRGLRSRFPHARIVVETDYPELFELNPYVNQAVRSTDGMDYDLMLHMRYEDRYPLREHITDIYCRCAGVPPQGRTLDLFFTVTEHRAVLERLAPFRRPVVTLQPWAGPWTRNKDWDQKRWERVVEALQRDHGVVCLQLGSPAEPYITGAVDWRDKTTLREAALTIKYARLHLACNSSSEQLAHAVGTPAIVLYGTTHPVISGYADQLALYGGKTATPCYHREPCEHRHAMEEIRVEDVLAAARRLFHRDVSKTGRRQKAPGTAMPSQQGARRW